MKILFVYHAWMLTALSLHSITGRLHKQEIVQQLWLDKLKQLFNQLLQLNIKI